MFTLEEFTANETTLGPDGKTMSGARQYVTNDKVGDSEHFDAGLMRPYRDDNGRVWVDVAAGLSLPMLRVNLSIRRYVILSWLVNDNVEIYRLSTSLVTLRYCLKINGL